MNVITPPHPNEQKSNKSTRPSTKRVPTTSQYYFVLQSLHKALPSTTLYYKACTKHFTVLLCTTKLAKHFPVLLCTTKLAQTTSQYYFLLQSLHKALHSTTLYYKASTTYFPVLLCTTKLAQNTSQYYFVLQSLQSISSQYYFVLQSLHKVFPSTTLYYKACTKHFPVLLCTTKLAKYFLPILLCTTKLAQSISSQYYFVLQALQKVRPSTSL